MSSDSNDDDIRYHLSFIDREELEGLAFRAIDACFSKDADIELANLLVAAIISDNTPMRRVRRGFRRAAMAIGGVVAVIGGGGILAGAASASAPWLPKDYIIFGAITLAIAAVMGGIVELFGWVVSGFFKAHDTRP